MGKRFEQLVALSLHEWCLMVTAILMLPVIGLLLRLRGIKGTQTLLDSLLVAQKELKVPAPAELEKTRVVARMIAVAASHGPYRAGCLRQSLLVQWVLAWHGISSNIRFGIEKEPTASFSAHAWVECGAVNITDGEACQLRFLAFEENREIQEDLITMNRS